MEIVLRGNDNILELDGLRNEITGAFLNAATVTATLVDSGGVNVTGQSWPLALDYVSDSDGIYRGTITDLAVFSLFSPPSAVARTQGFNYIAKVTADGGSDLLAYWEIPLQALDRTS